MTLFFPLSWRYYCADIIVLQETWKKGVPVGIVLTPNHCKKAVDLSSCSGLPVMVDNGAYTAWKKNTEPNWDKALEIAENLDATYIVALDKIGEPEESLKLSLETFKATHIEKIVPFHAITLGANNSKQIKEHLRVFLDNGVRVFGIPCPASDKKNNLKFALSCRWIIPTRCHALGFPFNNKRYLRHLKYFETVDATFWNFARSTTNRREMWREIADLYKKSRTPETTLTNILKEE